MLPVGYEAVQKTEQNHDAARMRCSHSLWNPAVTLPTVPTCRQHSFLSYFYFYYFLALSSLYASYCIVWASEFCTGIIGVLLANDSLQQIKSQPLGCKQSCNYSKRMKPEAALVTFSLLLYCNMLSWWRPATAFIRAWAREQVPRPTAPGTESTRDCFY